MQHPLRYAANCSILFTERPLLDRPAAARAAGFGAIEFWWPFDAAAPPDAEVERFVAAVAGAGVTLVGLNFAAGDMPGGDRGLLSWPARSGEFRDSVDIAVGIGERLGTRVFNALYGNRLDDATAAQQDDLAVANLTLAAAAAGRIGATVLVEPVSGAPRYPLRTAADAIAVLERASDEGGVTNAALLADLYHLTVNGDDLAAVIARYHGRIGHVQIADVPGRGEPGTGTIDLDRHLTALAETGYRGWVSLEYRPTTPATEDSLRWLPRPRRAASPDSRPDHLNRDVTATEAGAQG